MNEEPEGLLKNYLNGEELLASNSLRARVSNEIEQTSKVIPKTGLRLFEPNRSWLQNRQIDACLEARRDLINVERVKKVSKLAVGEWLPQERRVIVTKRSGIDWNNFGCELRGTLYLNPEEALLKVELNCLDLFFNGVSLSVQQAYELLINSPNSDCSLEEYRVYSQLARSGYRLKRFYYEKSDYEKDESSQLKKKVIIDLEGSQWMSGAPLSQDTADKNTKNDAEFVINSIIDKIEVEEQNLEDKSAENILNKIENDIKSKDKNKRRLNIVSVETMVEPVKLVANKKETNPSLGIRIQRNVKLLPKRTDKIIPSYLNIDSNSGQITSDKFNINDSEKVAAEKRKFDVINSSVPSTSSSSLESLKEVTLIPVKKIKNERIELSDDEIEEIPIPMTRKEMLNCLPNIKDKNCIKVTIDPKYIPQDIKLNKNTIEYDSLNLNDSKNNYQNNRQLANYSNSFEVNKNWQYNNYNTNNYQRSHYQNLPNYNNMMYGNSNYNYPTSNYSNQQSVSNRWSSLHVNFFKNIAMATFALRTSITQSLSNIYASSFDPGQYFTGRQNSRYYNPGIYHNNRNYKPIDNNTNRSENKNDLVNVEEDSNFENYCSFEKAPADSWMKLKKLWKDAKTITIEDDNDHIDCSEVEVINHTIQPLVGPKYSSSLKQIYDRLKIIKPAQDKSVRKKRGLYKISYKVYSNTQLYRKASPGHAMLYQDGDGIAIVFAHVSGATICFMQAGVVSLPNLE
ncbi:Similar to Tsen54: tRNA-splicing endonuclease subunit Sen54 (Mus musculus) [Cotesia congregata]|uniref:Similar to Tsen54: tRNA-splicing endonuclease subunit Sen54 (Mus musculus) n=1 Tax=Cotesia congregata TaxID=51543 RepID=A0A8J2HCQ3_COTCN|nr:Similar to Tsen54: tRNA-splicing endonuclease subunit Sen54 (Mus musculus) [Cotesia congregata]